MKKSILVVEDDNAIRSALSDFLEDEGYTVYGAENGLAALESLRLYGLPNLILTDMVMPVMSGWQFGSKLADLYGKKVPVVVMTAATDAERRAKDIGASGWIGKPFKLEALLETIKKLEKNS